MSDPGAPCLITGATGFIGGHVAERLLAGGTPVRCLVRASSDTARLRALAAALVVGDLTDRRSLEAAVAGCEAVVHCGAMVSDWGTVAEITDVNVGGTQALLRAGAAAGVRRIVHLSTTDVYGYPGAGAFDEARPPQRFRNWYAETKRGAEAAVRASQVPETVILRPATVYGPRSVEVVGAIARALRGRQMLLVGGGRAVAGLCFVDNLVDAVELALRSPAAPGMALTIADGLDVTWRRLCDDLADGLGVPRARLSLPYPVALALGTGLEHGYRLARRATGVRLPPLLSRQAVHVLGIDQSFDGGRAGRVLGWAPRIGYAAGLALTLEWLRAA